MICDVRMQNIAEAFGEVFEGALKRRELTSKQVAARAGVDVEHVEELIRGMREPKIGSLIRLAFAIGVSPIWLVEEVVAHAELHHDFALPASLDERNARVRAVGAALTTALMNCSDQELMHSAVVGDRLLAELAKYALTVVALPGRGSEVGSSIQ